MKRFVRKQIEKLPVVRHYVESANRLQREITSIKKRNEELVELAELRKGDIGRLQERINDQNDPLLSTEYQHVTNELFQIHESDIEKSKAATAGPQPVKIKTASWIIPAFKHISFGGLYTIFRAIEKMSKEGVKNTIIIYGGDDALIQSVNEQIKNNFKDLNNYELFLFDHKNDNYDSLPESDVAFCTHWVSAYILLRYNKTRKKYYFIQDYEPMFYAAGSVSAIAESTYRFGFRGIINTPGLEKAIHDNHAFESVSFMPGIDHELYRPDPNRVDTKKIRIFFYARPSKQRNAFELGVETIRNLKRRYSERIEIITAGEEWDESVYDLQGKITNLGLLKTVQEVAKLYSSCHIGFSFMMTQHPSYQPIEFMASGVATVINMNESSLWFLKDGKNCLISEPSPLAMADAISKLIENSELRKRIAMNGQKHTKDLIWKTAMDDLWTKLRSWR